ncbi:MAG: threonine--tRNA ligase [Candidatus Woesearchaeota archaeon]
MSISIEFPDGSKKEYHDGITGLEVAQQISEGLARVSYGMKLNNEVHDIKDAIDRDAKIQFLTWKDEEGKEILRHTGAHIFAQALLRLYPHAKIAIGPPIESGFHYDFELDKPLTPEDLEKIESEMKKIVNEKIPVAKKELTRDEALQRFKDNEFKVELISGVPDKKIRIYEQAEFSDFCRGPHVPNTSMVKAFKLTKVSGAYWKADAKNKQLQRVYGVVFPDKKDLSEYLHRLEEAEKRDHRKIGKDLDLTMFHEYSPGAPFFLNKGTVIYNILVDFIREEYRKRGYEEVITPQLYNKKLWEQSGHWEHYKDNMFVINIEGEEHSLKPMNCPSHCLIYNRKIKSYRDLPIRIADFCNLHRNELSGTLSGMTRVRKFAQDDAHIFCRLDQVEKEVLDMLDFIESVWVGIFKFKLTYYLSTRPEKALGDKDVWDKAESMLKSALDKAKIKYEIKEGDGAFYGPKIDIDLEDALGRKWQCPTVQLDFNLPDRFDCNYEGEDGKKHQCVMIHRAVLGSIERFMGLMIEHYAGKFPMWISPEQVRLLPIADRHVDYCMDVKKKMEKKGLRVTVDSKTETTNKKVRNAQLDKVNYILIVGDKEVENKTINVRTRDEEILGEKPVDLFIEELVSEVTKRI